MHISKNISELSFFLYTVYRTDTTLNLGLTEFSGVKVKAGVRTDLMVSPVHLVHGDVPPAVNLLPRRLPPLTLSLRHDEGQKHVTEKHSKKKPMNKTRTATKMYYISDEN